MNDNASLRMAVSVHPPLLAQDSGPGLRWLLFLQGCRRPCTNQCLNPHYLDPRGGQPISFETLRLAADQVAVGTYGRVEGITLLGGEPTDQAEALLPFLAAAQGFGLSVMLYSGHPLRWFHQLANRTSLALLDYVDILVDGPFIPSRARAHLRWRGSDNQLIRLLSDRYSESDLLQEQAHVGVTVTLPGQGLPVISGLQNRKAAAVVEAQMLRQASI